MGGSRDLEQAEAGGAGPAGAGARLEHAQQPEARGRVSCRIFGSDRKVEHYFHPYFSTRSRRDRLTVGLQPTVWYNDAGGVTLGIRSRDDYLGRFEQNQTLLTRSTGWGADDEVEDTDFFFRVRNPVALRMPNVSQTLDVFNVEGRYGAAACARVDSPRGAPDLRPDLDAESASLQWVATDDFRYLDRGSLRRCRHGRAAARQRREQSSRRHTGHGAAELGRRAAWRTTEAA